MTSTAAASDQDAFVPTDDLTYFVDEGIRSLLRAMLKQSVKDIVHDRRDSRAPADVSASARWPQTKAGRECIEFLMPGVTTERLLAKIYDSPEAVLLAMENTEGKGDPESRGLPVSSLGLDDDERDAMFQRNDAAELSEANEGADHTGLEPKWA